MKNSHELFCLVSIGSTWFNRDIISKFDRWTKDCHYQIRYVILSEPERHNIEAFEGISDAEAAVLARKRALNYQQELGLCDAAMLSWEEVCPRIGFQEAYKKVMHCYTNNRAFQRHCLSQTFSNLQPRFARYGVRKKTDVKVHKSVLYLLEELALKVGAFESGAFAGELLPHSEMDVTKAVYSGAYFNCPVSRQGFTVFSLTSEGVSHVHYAEARAVEPEAPQGGG